MRTNEELENEIEYLRGRVEDLQNDKEWDKEKRTIHKMFDRCVLENKDLKIRIRMLEKAESDRQAHEVTK